MTRLSRVWPSSIEWKTGGMPSASTTTPTIWTIVVIRKNQSSVSYAEANQVKLIQAQQIANIANAKPPIPLPRWPSATMGQLVGGLPEGGDEREVEQQLQRRRGPVRLVGVASGHPGQGVAEGRGQLWRGHVEESVSGEV